MNNYVLLISLAVFIGLLAVINHSEEPMPDEVQYCEMVDTWNETDGEYGWPDYNENFDEVCEDE